jgi:anti-sigma factor RsiW
MIASNDLTCKEFVEIVTEYLEGCLPVEERLRFEAHLQSCSGCRTYLEQMRQTIQALGWLPEVQIPHETLESLVDAFRDWKENCKS